MKPETSAADRATGWAAIGVALLAVVLNLVFWKRQPAAQVPTAAATAAKSATSDRPADPAVPAQPDFDPSRLPAEADRKIAAREEAICASAWPPIARMRKEMGLSSVATPKTLNELLNLLLAPEENPADAEKVTAAREKSLALDCSNNHKQIGVYVLLYESKHRKWPFFIQDLMSDDLAQSESLFVCKLDPNKGPCSYVYVYPVRGDDTPDRAILTYDNHVHPNGTRAYQDFGGKTHQVPDADFQALLTAQREEEREAYLAAIPKAREAAADPKLDEKGKERALKELELLERMGK